MHGPAVRAALIRQDTAAIQRHTERIATTTPVDLEALADHAIDRVGSWLARAEQLETSNDRRNTDRIAGVVDDPNGASFALQFVDRVLRPESDRAAAQQLASLARRAPLPGFLSRVDRTLLRGGAWLGPLVPGVVMPLARRRMRGLVGQWVVDAEPAALGRHVSQRHDQGFSLNVNLLGEAVLGDAEAERRMTEALQLLDQPDVDYVSVKVSSLVAQLNHWDRAGSIERVTDRLRTLFARAAATDPPTFVNLDMEEYHDLELTMAAFTAVLDEPDLLQVDAGIVLQAYLPDAFPALKRLVEWATARGRTGGRVKIRLVKGANLAMERVDAAMHGWEQAPYLTKPETDANYKRCLDWVLTPERTEAVRIGVASHNLFDVAWAELLADERGVGDRIELEMLEGMAAPQAKVALADRGGLLLYTPAVVKASFDVAIGYLFRRLEENAADENFIRHLPGLRSGSTAFDDQAERFSTAVRQRTTVSAGPRRTQDRSRGSEPVPARTPFANEPDTDPTLATNQRWIADVMGREVEPPSAPLLDDPAEVDAALGSASRWDVSPGERHRVLYAVADELARRRGDLVAAMIHEGNKTIEQADTEVSEAVDFARYYAHRALELVSPAARFEPLGLVAVVPPWNFPVAIPAGGVLAALAAGNAVVLKPAPETPRCAELVAECCWGGGVPESALRFVRTRDDAAGRRLVSHPGADAVILTGAYETAALFRSWKPDLRLFAETSGKNAIVVTASADTDLAVADLVTSAFAHSGQKCSAASLAICVGEAYGSDRFRRQLADAVTSLHVGPAGDLGTTTGPLVAAPSGKLLRALTELDPGETWLVEPRQVDADVWAPGVRLGVRPGSWFHTTECFGPVLGLMAAETLDDAIAMQNATPYGLTGGIHSLDPSEVERWIDGVEVGNAYVNRPITGAIVRRQPFGGWKRSSVGPGAKAGGPNYVAQLGRWVPTGPLDEAAWLASDADAMAREFSVDHDPTGLFCEANVLRYRSLDRVAVRVEVGASAPEVARVQSAASACGVAVVLSHHEQESTDAFAERLGSLGVERVRVLGGVSPQLRTVCNRTGVHLADDPVTSDGRIELLHYLREQTLSRTLHRYGNLT